MPDQGVDEELVKQLKMAKRKPRYFLLVAKTSKEGKLIVSKKKIKPAQIKELKSETGGKKVFVGTCQGEDGASMIFELTEEGPPNGDKLLKKLIKEDAGLKMMPQIRVVTELSTVDEEEAPEAPEVEEPLMEPPPPPEEPDDATTVKKLKRDLAKLIRLVNKVITAQPSRKTEVIGRIAEIKEAIDGGDTDTARTKLQETTLLVKELSSTAPGQDGSESQPESWNFDPAKWSAAKENWESAFNTVHGQISELQKVMYRDADPELKEIARSKELGLIDLTGNNKTPLTAAIIEFDSASGEARKQFALKAQKVAGNFVEHLKSERVYVCDNNPFKVKVSMRETLGSALKQMQEALKG